MQPRKAQINFQVDAPLKDLYDRAKRLGHRVPRYCAAGLLLLLEDATVRNRALELLVEWEDGTGEGRARIAPACGVRER